MTEQEREPGSLRNHFLVASPYLADPRFHGAVVYICDHTREGALGLVVNQPLDVSLGEILDQLDMPGGHLDEPVFGGGPVQPERGFVLHPPATGWQNTAAISDSIQLTTSRDILTAIGADQGPPRFVVVLGYSGWSEGQLEEELSGNAWLSCTADASLLFDTPWQERYEKALRLIGVDMNQLSQSTGHA